MKYELRTETLQDIVSKVPQEKLDVLFEEMQRLCNQMYAAKAISDLMKLVGEAVGQDVKSEWPDTIEWRDDGKGEVETKIVDGESGDTFVRIGKD